MIINTVWIKPVYEIVKLLIYDLSMENSNQLVKCNKLKTSTAMFQDYKLKIEFENCSYDYPYLVEGCANSCIKLIIDSENFPTLQSKKNIQKELQNVIKVELGKFKWIIYNDVNLEFVWYFSCLRKKESDKIGDLDNLIKPIIDAFSGDNGLFIDDSQIGSINNLWMSRDISSSQNSILIIFVHFNNDDCCLKENMKFVQIEKQMYAVYNFDVNSINDLYRILILHHMQRKKRKIQNKLLHTYPNIDMFSTDFNLFHRTRLKDIPNNKVYTWDKFKQLCIDAGLNFKELLKREKKRLQKK